MNLKYLINLLITFFAPIILAKMVDFKHNKGYQVSYDDSCWTAVRDDICCELQKLHDSYGVNIEKKKSCQPKALIDSLSLDFNDYSDSKDKQKPWESEFASARIIDLKTIYFKKEEFNGVRRAVNVEWHSDSLPPFIRWNIEIFCKKSNPIIIFAVDNIPNNDPILNRLRSDNPSFPPEIEDIINSFKCLD